MNPRWSGLIAAACLSLGGCTRDNPAFGTDEGGDDTADSGADASSSFTGGTSTTSAGEDTAVDGGSDGTGSTDAFCGNDIVEPPEECDKGELNSNVGHCKIDCTYNFCGDGFVG